MDPALLQMLSMGAPQEDPNDPNAQAAKQAALSQLSGTPPGSMGTDMNQSRQQYADAQEQARQNRIATGIGQALDKGVATATNTRPDSALYQNLQQDANAPVRNLQDKNGYALSMAKAQKELDGADPSSKKSTLYRTMFKGVASKAGLDIPDEQLQFASADDIEKLNQGAMTMADFKLKTDMLKQQHDDTSAYRDAMLGQKSRGLDIQAQKASNSSDKDQGKAYTDMRQKLETFRGNQGAQQASRDVYSVNKALGIVQGKDPNTLTTQDLNLLADEIAKVATGGIPGEHGITPLLPNNLQTKYAEMKNFLLSSPTDAQSGEYVRRNMNYLNQMGGEAQKVLNSYRGNIMKGYRGRVSDENYQEALHDYGLDSGNSPQGQSQSNPSVPQSAQGGSIKMKLPNGNTVNIPAQNVDAAKARGATVVQ